MLARVNEAKEVFGSDDTLHPGVHYLLKTAKEFYIGGKLEALNRLEHYDFLDLRCKGAPRSHPHPYPRLTVVPSRHSRRAPRSLREARLAARRRLPDS